MTADGSACGASRPIGNAISVFVCVGGVSEEREVKFPKYRIDKNRLLKRMLKEKAEQICSAFSFVCIYAGSRLISGSGLRIMPFRYEAVRGVSALPGAAALAFLRVS